MNKTNEIKNLNSATNKNLVQLPIKIEDKKLLVPEPHDSNFKEFIT